MFAFSQIQPETTGNVMDMEVPVSKYLGASVEAGIHSQLLTSIYRWSELREELNDDTQEKLSMEDANKQYAIGDLKFDEPITDSAARLLRQRKEAEMDRNFLLTNDNHSALAGAAGMTTSMVASMLNPIDLALMFLPVVGGAAKLGHVTDIAMLSRGNRIRETVAAGFITREALAEITRFPKFVDSLIQGGSYMVMTEPLRQALAKHEHVEAGDPYLNIATGTAMSGAFHMALTAVGRAWQAMPSRSKMALMQKGMDDFVKGKDINVTGLARTDEAFVAEQMLSEDHPWPKNELTEKDFLTGPEADAQRLSNMSAHIKQTFESALQKLRQDILPPKEPPVIPETKAQNEQLLYTSALDEIRKRNARTTAQVQAAFPKAQLSREEAAVLRRQVWGESEVKAQTQANIIELLQQEKNRADQEALGRQKGTKRIAREQALEAMPAAPEIVVKEQAHDVVIPQDKTIAPVEKQTAELKKKATPKKPKAKEDKYLTPDQEETLIRDTQAISVVQDKQYAPALRNKEGEVFTGAIVPRVQYKDAGLERPDHSLIYNNVPKGKDNGIKNGYVDKQGNFLTLLDVARKEMALKEQAKSLTSPESIGLVKQKGALGKKGFWTSNDKRLLGLSIVIGPDVIELRSIERDTSIPNSKGVGAETLGKLKQLADEQQKPIRLIAEALGEKDTHLGLDAEAKQIALENYYIKQGFEDLGDQEFEYTPEALLKERNAPREAQIQAAEQIKPISEAIKAATDCLGKKII